MWLSLAKFVLKHRFTLSAMLLLSTVFMAFLAKDVEMNYQFSQIMPKNDPINIEYQNFKKQFGDDGTRLMIGIQTDKFFDKDFFNDWYETGQRIPKIDGVTGVLSLAHAFDLKKDTTNKNFSLAPLVTQSMPTQAASDSLKTALFALPFYDGLLYNRNTNAYIMGVNIEAAWLDSDKRVEVVYNILAETDAFAKRHNIEMHYSGLPYLRTFRATSLLQEMTMFMVLSIVVAILILLVLFKSWRVVLFPLANILVGITFSLGLVVAFGFKMSLLTGLIPSLIVVISVPNSVYMFNRYLKEMKEHGDKNTALQVMLTNIGQTIFFANLTTAIGFSVFAFMESDLLYEFGIIAGLSIAMLFISSLIIIPTVLSVMPAPEVRHTKHLEGSFAIKLVKQFENIVLNHHKTVQIGAIAVFLAALFGVSQMQVRGYIFDDMSYKSKEYKDLKFFEKNFNGVLPFDILIDTNKKQGVTKLSNLKRIEKVQQIFAEDTLFSRALSLTDGFKLATQAYFNGQSQFYKLPSNMEKGFVLQYLAKTKTAGSNDLLKSFTDSTQQVARVSVQMADVGSDKFNVVLDSVQARIASVIDTSKYKVTYTGSSRVAIAGYNYLINGLINSVLLAFLLIAVVIGLLFRRVNMLLIAFIPNILPLTITAAIMGFFAIFLKPSTVLIFSVAFGISVDFTIHFLAKYKQLLAKNGDNVKQAISDTLSEMGLSMVYTAIILFLGFIIFTASNFQGTFYLGLLTSITIIIALLANMVLLPSVLMNGHKAEVSEKEKTRASVGK